MIPDFIWSKKCDLKSISFCTPNTCLGSWPPAWSRSHPLSLRIRRRSAPHCWPARVWRGAYCARSGRTAARTAWRRCQGSSPPRCLNANKQSTQSIKQQPNQQSNPPSKTSNLLLNHIFITRSSIQSNSQTVKQPNSQTRRLNN